MAELDKSKEGIIKAWFKYDFSTDTVLWQEWISPEWYKQKWRYENFMRDRAGKPVIPNEDHYGYLYVSAGGICSMPLHQVIWVLVHGAMPQGYIDHIDGDKKNNVPSNLRDVPQKINTRNQKMRSTNKSGITGVHWDQSREKWVAQIMVDGRAIHLGRFLTKEAAGDARLKFMTENRHYGFSDRHGLAED